MNDTFAELAVYNLSSIEAYLDLALEHVSDDSPALGYIRASMDGLAATKDLLIDRPATPKKVIIDGVEHTLWTRD